MSIVLEGGFRVVCDGMRDNGIKCNAQFQRDHYVKMEDVVLEAITSGAMIFNPATDKHYCKSCSQTRQQGR